MIFSLIRAFSAILIDTSYHRTARKYSETYINTARDRVHLSHVPTDAEDLLVHLLRDQAVAEDLLVRD